MAAEIEVLKQLEERVQASLNRIDQLEKENEILAQRLAESETRFSDASAELKQQHEARGEIRTKIEQILARFNGLELG